MKTFNQYLKEVDATSGGIGLGDLAVDPAEDGLMHIAKIAIDDHHPDVLAFFQHLASKDNRIAQELEDYKNNKKHGKKGSLRMPPFQDDGRDELVPNAADSVGSLEGGEG